MQAVNPASLSGRHVVLFNWRDTQNPEGGGSERYVEAMARGLVARGARGTVFCADHGRAPARRGRRRRPLRPPRRPPRDLPQGHAPPPPPRFGKVDLVVDVQNGLPFFTRLATRAPVVVLVHHVHREQWPVVYPGLLGRVGWWIERVLAPRLYRRSQYVAVSRATRRELIPLGVGRDRIAVVHNGTEPAPVLDVAAEPAPLLCVLGGSCRTSRSSTRSTPIVALRADHPDASLVVVGNGWWEESLRTYVAERGADDPSPSPARQRAATSTRSSPGRG